MAEVKNEIAPVKEDNRRRVRFKAHFYCKCSFNDGSKLVSAVAKDISMSGLRIIFDSAANISDQAAVPLYLLFPDKTIKALGSLVWIKKYSDRQEAGIVFKNIADFDKEEIYQYIFRYYREEVLGHWWAAS
ncbi:MAG: PilZ domain-containing protein [Candidatus Omnitrophica bacterium]|nr:PilZ domain-containing protein [Candidatus Omnitrophota bacterium]